jgi:hypothetical protein
MSSSAVRAVVLCLWVCTGGIGLGLRRDIMPGVGIVLVPVGVQGPAVPVHVGVTYQHRDTAPHRCIERMVLRPVRLVMIVPVMPMHVLDEPRDVTMIVVAMAQSQRDLEAVRFRDLLQAFPKAAVGRTLIPGLGGCCGIRCTLIWD